MFFYNKEIIFMFKVFMIFTVLFTLDKFAFKLLLEKNKNFNAGTTNDSGKVVLLSDGIARIYGLDDVCAGETVIFFLSVKEWVNVENLLRFSSEVRRRKLCFIQWLRVIFGSTQSICGLVFCKIFVLFKLILLLNLAK